MFFSSIVRAQRVGEEPLVDELGEAHADARHLVFVGRTDAAAGGADAALAAQPLARLIDGAMIRHDQVGAVADLQQALVLEVAARAQRVDLLDQRGRIDDDAVADDADLAGVQHAGGHQMQDGLLVADDERVAGIVAALVAHDDVGVLGEDVDDLALAFVAPLSADTDDRWHAAPHSARLRRRVSSALTARALSPTTMLGSVRSRSSTCARDALVDVDQRDRHAADASRGRAAGRRC